MAAQGNEEGVVEFPKLCKGLFCRAVLRRLQEMPMRRFVDFAGREQLDTYSQSQVVALKLHRRVG